MKMENLTEECNFFAFFIVNSERFRIFAVGYGFYTVSLTY